MTTTTTKTTSSKYPININSDNVSLQTNSLKLIQNLRIALNIKNIFFDPLSYCNKPSEGSSGFTFLCRAPYCLDYKKNLKEIQNTEQTHSKFVVKWVKKNQGELEKKCSDLFKKLNFNTPDITLIDYKTGKILIDIMQKKINCVSNVDQSYSLLFMPEFQGKTLSDLLNEYSSNNKLIFNWKNFFCFCGKLVISDCFIANTDRFSNFNPLNLDETYQFKTTNGINGGNLMLSFDNEIFFALDNSSECLQKEVLTNSEKDEDMNFNMFDEQITSSNKNCSPPQDTPNIEKQREDSERKRNDDFHKMFTFFSEPKNHAILAQCVIDNFIKETKKNHCDNNVSKLCFQQFFEDVKEGISLGLEKIKTLKIEKIDYQETSCNLLYELISKNILHLKQQNQK